MFVLFPPELTNGDIREALLTLSRAFNNHVNMGLATRVVVVESSMTSILGEFARMNPFIVLGPKAEEDTQDFLDGVYKVLNVMGVISKDNTELASYQLREVSQVRYTQWKYNRPIESAPIEWEEFKRAFLWKYFFHVRRKVKIGRFIDLSQGKGKVEESKLRKSASNLKKSGLNYQGQPTSKKRAQTQDGPSAPDVKFDKGGGSKNAKPTSATCMKRNYRK